MSLSSFTSFLWQTFPEWAERMKPASPKQICELEQTTQEGLPPQYRAFLELMGGNRRGELNPFLESYAFDVASMLANPSVLPQGLPIRLAQRLSDGKAPSHSDWIADTARTGTSRWLVDNSGRVGSSLMSGSSTLVTSIRYQSVEHFLNENLFAAIRPTETVSMDEDVVVLSGAPLSTKNQVREQLAQRLASHGFIPHKNSESSTWYDLFGRKDGTWVWYDAHPLHRRRSGATFAHIRSLASDNPIYDIGDEIREEFDCP